MSKATSSKYIMMSTMTVPEFANSPVGTVAQFILSRFEHDSRFEVAKSIKSACNKAGSLCTQVTTKVLFESKFGDSFTTSKMITCTITKVREGYSERRI